MQRMLVHFKDNIHRIRINRHYSETNYLVEQADLYTFMKRKDL